MMHHGEQQRPQGRGGWAAQAEESDPGGTFSLTPPYLVLEGICHIAIGRKDERQVVYHRKLDCFLFPVLCSCLTALSLVNLLHEQPDPELWRGLPRTLGLAQQPRKPSLLGAWPPALGVLWRPQRSAILTWTRSACSSSPNRGGLESAACNSCPGDPSAWRLADKEATSGHQGFHSASLGQLLCPSQSPGHRNEAKVLLATLPTGPKEGWELLPQNVPVTCAHVCSSS